MVSSPVSESVASGLVILAASSVLTVIASDLSLPDPHGGGPILFSNELYFLEFQMLNWMKVVFALPTDAAIDVLYVMIYYTLDMNHITKIAVGCTDTVWSQGEDVLLKKLCFDLTS